MILGFGSHRVTVGISASSQLQACRASRSQALSRGRFARVYEADHVRRSVLVTPKEKKSKQSCCGGGGSRTVCRDLGATRLTIFGAPACCVFAS